MARAWGSSWASSWGSSWGSIAAAAALGGRRRGKRKKQKHHIASWDLAWQEPLPPVQPEIDRETPPEVVEVVNARAQAETLAKATIEHRREISRIRAQMRLSSNEAALRTLEAEIGKIEAHLAKLKQEAEDMLMLTILM